MSFLDSKKNRSIVVAIIVSLLTLIAVVQRYSADFLIRKNLKKATKVEVTFYESDGAKQTLIPIESKMPTTLNTLTKSIELRKAHSIPKRFSGYLMFYEEDQLISPEKIYFSLNPAYHLVTFELSGKTYQRKLSVKGRKLLARYLYELKR